VASSGTLFIIMRKYLKKLLDRLKEIRMKGQPLGYNATNMSFDYY